MLTKKKNCSVGFGSGLWLLEEFEFFDGVIGTAKVWYEVRWRRLLPHECVEGDFSKPYAVRVGNPVVVSLELDLELDRVFNVAEYKTMRQMVLDAWRDNEEDVVGYEMGLL